VIVTQPKELIAAFVNERQGVDVTTPWASPFNALGWMNDGKLVAGVIYNLCEARNINMHIGAVDGKKWLTREFLFAAFDYPFNQLQVRRVTAPIKARLKNVHEFVENLGFKREAVIPHYFADDDMVLYGMLRKNCRFLEMRYEQRRVA
jgi:RimJ/RimL family protein N-acetyltransferase